MSPLLPHHLRAALSVLQVAAFGMLVRSVAYDRWITVAVAAALLAGAVAAERGRTWGVALSLALGVTIAGVWALGIAPLWFLFVGVLAVLPFVKSFGWLSRFDRGAAATLAVMAAGLGGVLAVAWKELALDLFRAFPILVPSVYPQHGIAVLALIAGGVAARRLLPAPAAMDAEDGASAPSLVGADSGRIRVAPPNARSDEDAALAELDAELEARSELPERRLGG